MLRLRSSGHGATTRASVAPWLSLLLPAGALRHDILASNAAGPAAAPAARTAGGEEWAANASRARSWEDLSGALAAGRYAGVAQDILSLAAPKPGAPCGCTLDRWDQYAMCNGAYQVGAEALSFGVMGYDIWAGHVQEVYKLVPKLYDCYDTRKPADFENEFFPTCIGGRAEEREGKSFETMGRLLPSGAQGAPALVKLDVETSEFEVLESMTPDDFSRISSLNVEYHFFSCPDEAVLERLRRVLHKVQEHLVVVDSLLSEYGDPSCPPGSSAAAEAKLPKLLAVSYASPQVCSGSGAA